MQAGEGKGRWRAAHARRLTPARSTRAPRSRFAGERDRLRRVKIYTRAGDDGTTGVLGPGRVSKADPRIEAYGTVDELNATLGAARADAGAAPLAGELETIQRQL